MEDTSSICDYKKVRVIDASTNDSIAIVQHNNHGDLMVAKSLGDGPVGVSNPVEINMSFAVKSNYLSKATDIIDASSCGLSKVTLVTELADGDLYDVITNNPNIPFRERMGIIFDVIRGLDVIHRAGYAHLDIKCENVLVKNGYAYITDFGFSRKMLNRSGSVRSPEDIRPSGSYLFCAPELIKPNWSGHYTRSMDMWALGHLIHLVLAGEYVHADFLDTSDDVMRLHEYYKREFVNTRMVDKYNLSTVPLDKISQIVLILESCFKYNPSKRSSPSDLLKYDIFKPYENRIISRNVVVIPNRIINPLNYNNYLSTIDHIITREFGDYDAYLAFLAADLFHRSMAKIPHGSNEMRLLAIVCIWIALKCIVAQSQHVLLHLIDKYGYGVRALKLYQDLEARIYRELEGIITPDYIYEKCNYREQLAIMYRDTVLNHVAYGYNVESYAIGDIKFDGIPERTKIMTCSELARVTR